MKKLWLSLLAITCTLGVFAQDSTNAMNKPKPHHDGIMMKDGKLLMMKNGQTTQLTTDMTLDNGTVVMTNGTVKAKDGSTKTLKEGDYVTMDGTSMGNMNDWKKDPNPKGKDSMMTDKMKTDSLK
jgi:hypothetical protein